MRLALPDRSTLLGFFISEAGAEGGLLFVLSALVGAAEAALMVGLAYALARGEDTVSITTAVGFIAATFLLVLVQVITLRRIIQLSEGMLSRVLLRLVTAARRIELLALERIGPQRLLDVAARDIAVLSNRQRVVFLTVKEAASAVVVLGVLLSRAPVIALMLIVVLVAFSRSAEITRMDADADLADDAEARLLDLARSVIAGVKELRVDARKREDLFAAGLRPAAQATLEPRLRIVRRINRFGQLQNAAIYLVAGVAAFSAASLGFGPDGAMVTFLVLYTTGSSSGIAYSISDLLAASGAVRRLRALEVELDEAASPQAEIPRGRGRFTTLQLEGVRFVYPSAETEQIGHIGPIDLTLRPRSIVFLVGGNGSGKSTLLKLITGLYPPGEGRMLLDGRPAGRAALRSLFAAVFSDFHLFERPFGPVTPDPVRMGTLLRRFGLAGKTEFVNGGFTTVAALCTGQRRRLALLVALLDDRPIYVFDEWAADQDPEFRHLFYTELLAEMREAGKLVIAATHDDRYFDRCDLLVVMEQGVVREIIEQEV